MGVTSQMPYQMDGVIDSSDGKRKWDFSGIELRGPLKPIFTKPDINEEDNDEEATTPTSEDSIISRRFLTCPPAPKKRKRSLKFPNFNDVRRRMDFFHVPDLEAVFVRRVEKG